MVYNATSVVVFSASAARDATAFTVTHDYDHETGAADNQGVPQQLHQRDIGK